MIITCKCIVLIHLALMTSQVQLAAAVMTTTETSEEYLRKVMIELQQMKQASSSSAASGTPIYLNPNGAHYAAAKRLLSVNSNGLRLFEPQRAIQPEIAASTLQIAPIKLAGSNLPTFTRNELNTLYKQALNTGNGISVSALKNVLSGGQLSTVSTNNINNQGNGRQPSYAYYFYPLKSFMSDTVQHNNGYHSMDLQTEPTANNFQETEKQMMMNPLFLAISTFVGMAIVFMLGVIIMPRIFPDFKSRFVHDELLDLTKTVTQAMDTYNKTSQRPPKKHYPETIVGIKTRPQGTSVRKRYRTTTTKSSQ